MYEREGVWVGSSGGKLLLLRPIVIARIDKNWKCNHSINSPGIHSCHSWTASSRARSRGAGWLTEFGGLSPACGPAAGAGLDQVRTSPSHSAQSCCRNLAEKPDATLQDALLAGFWPCADCMRTSNNKKCGELCCAACRQAAPG